MSSGHKGFKLEYSTANCDRNYTSEQGRIIHEGFTSCWIMITAPANHTISLYFNQFSLYDSEPCTHNAMQARYFFYFYRENTRSRSRYLYYYLLQKLHVTYSDMRKQILTIDLSFSYKFLYFQIHDGNSSGPLLTTLCNTALPSPIFSTNNMLTLHSWAESTNSYQSYDLVYTTTDAGTMRNRTNAQIPPLHPINAHRQMRGNRNARVMIYDAAVQRVAAPPRYALVKCTVLFSRRKNRSRLQMAYSL